MAKEHDKNHIKDPRIVHIIDNQTGEDRNIRSENNRMVIPLNAQWKQFNNSVNQFLQEGDGVILTVAKGIDLSQSGAGTNMSIKTNTINKVANQNDKHVLSKDSNNRWYLVNPTNDGESRKLEKSHSPANEDVMAKFESFESEEKWQEHQSGVWDKLQALNGLNDGSYKFAPNHKAELMDPKRGLDEEDVDKFWSYRSFQTLNPAVLEDDMVGMPGVNAKVREDIKMTPAKGPNAGETIEINPLVLRSEVMNGYMIPMSNAQGFTAKHQIATDESVFNTRLRPRTKDGTSIVKSEIEENGRDDNGRKRTEYKFNINGEKSHLHVADVGLQDKDNITLKDINGSFKVSMGEDVKDKLLERGYDMPDMVDSLSVEKNAKYIWPGVGSMTGSNKDVQRTVSPSNAGFIKAREPKENNKEDEYVVVVTEGALKGHIAAKYLGKEGTEKNPSIGDYLAKDRGIIVAQVPGVSKAFVESVAPIYDEYNVKGTYIAMDADGRENKRVAVGIKDSENILSEHSPTKVMSWNPEQKGLDDALIAMDQGKINAKEFGLKLGSADKLFPISKSEEPNPYRLDGSRAHDPKKKVQPQWQKEYEESAKKKEEKVREAQKQTELRNNATNVKNKEVNITSTEAEPKHKGLEAVDSEKVLEVQKKIADLQAESEEFNKKQAEKLESIGKELADLLPEGEGLQL